ncbi:GNAT family N-acetyltransferase [Peptoniphilus catoniae]|uniref:GNAT family N-acetyltransferase n=1 Tax=Peptoniphilus catoniae TaxID=1660341 RepID=UPI0010FEC19B|nr:GNAT family N-acetyltransferase [Peptoniphilus catoniae]
MKRLYGDENLTYYLLDKSHIDDIISLTDEIHSLMDDKSMFVRDDREELEAIFDSGGEIIGVYDKDRLIAFRCTNIQSKDKSFINDMDYVKGNDKTVVYHGSCMVHMDYRGRNLQNITRSLIEEYLEEHDFEHFYSTVSPSNPYSFKNVFKNGYKIVALKNVYQDEDKPEGYLRFIFYKNRKAPFDLINDEEILIEHGKTEEMKRLLVDNYLGVSYNDKGIVFKKLAGK